MPDQDAMTIDERRKYLRIVRRRHKKADRRRRGVLLDEIQEVTGLQRKTLTRLMHGSLERKPRRRRWGRTYGAEVDDALRVIAESYDYICAERLQPNLVGMAEQLAAHQELRLSPNLLDRLGEISVPTVRRILRRISRTSPVCHGVGRSRPIRPRVTCRCAASPGMSTSPATLRRTWCTTLARLPAPVHPQQTLAAGGERIADARIPDRCQDTPVPVRSCSPQRPRRLRPSRSSQEPFRRLAAGRMARA